MNKIANYIFYFFCVWYVCGFVLVGLDILPSWLEWSNSVFIITAGILGIVYFMIRYSNGFGLIISTLIFLTTFLIEYFGSAYAILFGAYTYTNQFAPNVFGVPIAIGFAWVMVIATGHAILSKQATQHPLVRALIGGLLALVMDLILDPVAFEVKGYWIWHEPGLYYNIPVHMKEKIITASFLESEFHAYRGALYGAASNSVQSAFFRPANRHRSLKNVYYVGGTVHPGGGSPLVTLGGMNVAKVVLEKLSKS